jgi:hypothetical protein
MNFANCHLMSAVRLAQAMHEIEAEHAGEAWGDFYTTMLSYATGVVMMSVASLEAFVAEVQFEAATRFGSHTPAFVAKYFGCGSFMSALDGNRSDRLHEFEARPTSGRGQRVRNLTIGIA